MIVLSVSVSLSLTSLPFFYALSPTTCKPRASPPRSTVSLVSSRRRQDRRRSIEAVTRDIHGSDLLELEDESDFEKLLSSDNRISIAGFGSLLSGAYTSLFVCVLIEIMNHR